MLKNLLKFLSKNLTNKKFYVIIYKMNEKGREKLKIEFGGFYPIPSEYINDERYITIGVHDGWIYPTKEQMKIYWKNVDEVIYGRKKEK